MGAPDGCGGRVIKPDEFLESSRIQWQRDWDALLIGFVLGVLATLAWVR